MQNILLVIFLVLFITFNGIVYQYKSTKEGYESLTSCIQNGYPTEFCYSVPIQACLTNCGNVDNNDLPRST
jgi:hypothetical protein